MQLLVVGAGEMGRWFARVSGADAVAFADRDPETARAAADVLRESSAAEAGDHLPEAETVEAPSEVRAVPLETDERFDAVCLAVPMASTPAVIAEHAPKATDAVLDVSGEMRDSVAALEAHAPERERASFHPLFSASNAPGNVPVVVGRKGPVVGTIREALSAAGNQVFETTPEEHDRAMETVQVKAHTAILAYALAAEDVDPRFHTTVSAPLEELVEDVVGNTPAVYAEIQDRFEGSESVAEAARELAAADGEAFVDLYETASTRR